MILLFAAQSMSNGSFTIGDFALFTTNIWTVTVWMRTMGNTLSSWHRVGISFNRMEKLMQGAPVATLPITRNNQGRRMINVSVMKELGIAPKPSALIGVELFKTED